MKKTLNQRIHRTTNLNIGRVTPLPSPAQIKADLPMTEKAWKTISYARKTVRNIIARKDDRFLLVLGPCSVHSVEEALQYGRWLAQMKKMYEKEIFFVMRLCFSKPRTRPDWRGFWSDPDLDGSYNTEKGWREGRKLALALSEIGIPIATEYNDVAGQQRMDDLWCLYWVGAREVTNQEFRLVASGLSCPVGFKNPITGPIQPALDSLLFARSSHVLTAVSDSGVLARFETRGNDQGFLILRGNHHGPNYSLAQVQEVMRTLGEQGLRQGIMVDFSHGNSGKDHTRQIEVCRAVAEHMASGSVAFGGLYESYLCDGNQKFQVVPGYRPKLQPGVSITDGCDGLERSEALIAELYETVRRK